MQSFQSDKQIKNKLQSLCVQITANPIVNNTVQSKALKIPSSGPDSKFRLWRESHVVAR